MINGKLHLVNPWIPPPNRLHDRSIMEGFINSERYSDSELTLLHYCRLYLRAFYISDIATSDGTCIREEIWSISPPHLPSPWQWPQQSSPSPSV
eukprot:8134469-Ditylum_brightwellii.AAC.2